MAPITIPDSSPTSLQETLSAALPAGFNCNILYVQSPTKQCDPLFSAPPRQSAERTRLASHFLTLSVDPASLGHETKDTSAGGSDVISFAIEVLLYTTKRLTTLFVSKVDSTSYVPRQKPSPIQTTVTTFLRWLADHERRQRPTRKVVVSLFARAQAQYLFPGSSDNKSKHVLDDRQLIKWWARVLDPIIPTSESSPSAPSYQGYITVPGYAGSELKRSFMPATSISSDKPNWVPGHPLTSLAATRHISVHAPPRCLLPRFPDDPKARFMQDLDDEIGISQDSQPTSSSNLSSPSKRGSINKSAGKWKSILDIDSFWEAMEFRQECSSGRVVGFLWLVISPPPAVSASSFTTDDVLAAESQETLAAPSSPTPTPSSPLPSNQEQTDRPTRRRKPLSGLIISRQPRLKPGSSSKLSTMSTTSSASLPGGGVLLSEEVYDKAMQTLLASDFSTLSAALRSTARWIGEVRSGVDEGSDVALKIVGRKVVEIAKTVEAVNGVNDLGGMIVRKKRKSDDAAVRPVVNGEAKAEQGETVNVLGAGMVRKKAKKV